MGCCATVRKTCEAGTEHGGASTVSLPSCRYHQKGPSAALSVADGRTCCRCTECHCSEATAVGQRCSHGAGRKAVQRALTDDFDQPLFTNALELGGRSKSGVIASSSSTDLSRTALSSDALPSLQKSPKFDPKRGVGVVLGAIIFLSFKPSYIRTVRNY